MKKIATGWMIVGAMLLAACGGDDEGGGASALEICEAFEASPNNCSDACFATLDAIESECASENAAVEALGADRDAYFECTIDCPTGATCVRGGVTLSRDDCDCAATCLGETSTEFQEAYTASRRCAERVYAAGCL
ncbi:hypothetical protein [Sandaracinus amylolyticus]|uniref:Lipoprotein n=1 Tax=Sandaracinus amylolyticus TaxID=927083 RepID=A0A0F6SE75_9BACT|nr:hypothetical protein [Sandaracinus amylolyticus]AKF04704.1 hypothetical protein DB32_001853 [Sandaracinus amylolyticus]